ncbi:hypothetical protein FACS1894201_07330 [Bacteroidia bacterium]|nr:hypothetical protein FACS1894201_07330 [Bacteroidia bacterium]
MIGHMLYVILFTRALKSTPSVEAMQQKRASKGLPDQATTSETAQCLQLLNEAWLTFSVMGKGENGEDTRSPKKMRELLNARKLVAQAGKLLPTDAEAHAEYAKYRQFLYDNLKRTFFSSWKLIILALIVAVGLAFLSGGKNDEQGFFYNFFTPGLPMFFWIPAIVYYISGNVPQFMIDQKAQRGGGGGWFASALVGLGLGALGSGYTVRTTYTDGSHEDDNSAHWIALMIGAVILFIVACTIYIWAIINYLRNYVLYI